LAGQCEGGCQSGEKDVLSIFGLLLKSECSVGELLLTSQATGKRHAATVIYLGFMGRLMSLTLEMAAEYMPASHPGLTP